MRKPKPGSSGIGLASAATASALSLTVLAARRRKEERRLVCGDFLPAAACDALHARKVARVARTLRERRAGGPLSLRKRAVSHEVPKAGDRRRSDEKLDIRDFDSILSLDPETRICVAESGVTFVDLVTATLRHGLAPAIVPELKTITLGGAVSGCSIESMSFRYGGFHDTCLEYEVVTGRGEVLRCTPDGEHAHVFQMMHGSFGTLGVLTRLAFRLVPAKPYVHVTYEKHGSVDAYAAAIERVYRSQEADFMDGIVHSPTECVLSLGRFVDEAPYTNRYDWTKVYYRSTRTRAEDYLRTRDYYFRYDHGVTNVFPRSYAGRLLLAPFLGSSRSLRLAERLNRFMTPDRVPFTLDVFLPLSRMKPFLEWYAREFRHFPLWCVPYKRVRDYEWINPRVLEGVGDELFADLAIYGMKPRADGRNYPKLMEEKLLELGGIKTLISLNCYSEEDFWKTWNREAYARAKAVTDPDDVFRDLYEKTCRASQGL